MGGPVDQASAADSLLGGPVDQEEASGGCRGAAVTGDAGQLSMRALQHHRHTAAPLARDSVVLCKYRNQVFGQ